MQRFTIFPLAILSALTITGCVGQVGDTSDDSGDDDGSDAPAPVTCDQARTYTNFGGEDLTVDRPTIVASSDRMRMKPFGALAAEYDRALGITGFTTAIYAGTFGKPPARWYEEPLASSATIYAAFSLAYDGCTRKTAAGGDFDTEPAATIANRLCHDFARAAWAREATDDEAAICASYAVDKTRASDPPRVRWAYTCASVLTASSFLAY